VMAVTHEPMFMFLGWLARIVPALGKVRDFLAKSTGRAGLRDGGTRGPMGLILFSFTVDPISGRGAAAAAGHGFVPGWTLAIIGDMMYFGVLMAATLWLSGMFGDERVTVGVTLLLVWGLSWVIRRRSDRGRGQPRPVPASAPSGALQPALATASYMEASPASEARQPVHQTVGRSKKARRKQRR